MTNIPGVSARSGPVTCIEMPKVRLRTLLRILSPWMVLALTQPLKIKRHKIRVNYTRFTPATCERRGGLHLIMRTRITQSHVTCI
jgi:hypothetical protein